MYDAAHAPTRPQFEGFMRRVQRMKPVTYNHLMILPPSKWTHHACKQGIHRHEQRRRVPIRRGEFTVDYTWANAQSGTRFGFSSWGEVIFALRWWWFYIATYIFLLLFCPFYFSSRFCILFAIDRGHPPIRAVTPLHMPYSFFSSGMYRCLVCDYGLDSAFSLC